MSVQPKNVISSFQKCCKNAVQVISVTKFLYVLNTPRSLRATPAAKYNKSEQRTVIFRKASCSWVFPEVQRCRGLCRSLFTNPCTPVTLPGLHPESKHQLLYAMSHDSSRGRVSSVKKVNENRRTSRTLAEGRFVWFQQWPQQWQVFRERETFGRTMSVF